MESSTRRRAPEARAVLFDLDDTLFDNRRSVREGILALHRDDERLGRLRFVDFAAEHTRLLEEVHHEVVHGRLPIEEGYTQRFRRLFARFGLGATDREAAAAARRYRAGYREAHRALPGAVALLEGLRGRAVVGIVTNHVASEQNDKLRNAGLAPFIDFLVTSEEVGEPKPGAAIFLEALARAGCGPGEAVMVGDSFRADVLGARVAGIRAVWFNPDGAPPPSEGHDAEIRSLEPISTVLPVILRGLHTEPLQDINHENRYP